MFLCPAEFYTRLIIDFETWKFIADDGSIWSGGDCHEGVRKAKEDRQNERINEMPFMVFKCPHCKKEFTQEMLTGQGCFTIISGDR